MVSHNSNLYFWWLSWTLARLKGVHSTQKLLYYMTPTALVPIPNKYALKDFSLFLDPEFKFHSENWRKRCSPSTSKDEIYRKGTWAHPYPVSPSCLRHIFYWDQGCILPSAFSLPLPTLSLCKCHDLLLQDPTRGKRRALAGARLLSCSQILHLRILN